MFLWRRQNLDWSLLGVPEKINLAANSNRFWIMEYCGSSIKVIETLQFRTIKHSAKSTVSIIENNESVDPALSVTMVTVQSATTLSITQESFTAEGLPEKYPPYSAQIRSIYSSCWI